MKTKMKFDDIKGMLRREEMKVVVGGDVYGGANTSAIASPSGVLAGTALSGSQSTSLGLTIAPNTNYSTSYNYGAGMNGSTSTSGTGANTFTNGGNTSGPTPPKPYAQP